MKHISEDIVLSPIRLSAIEEMVERVVTKALDKKSSQEASCMPESTKEEYLTRKQAADLFMISTATLDTWWKSGKIPAHRLNTRVRFKRKELEDALQKVSA